ncbi:hypothetical protein M501DRAFT_997866 [Patellaria atrata CBS 101060]|uniref:Pathogenesis associated protein Cap20 n=1 Tax=Patellaria atrata CBS 101060 TaxID=1346257 RepID=A0A9P4VNH7_9PEZI|nr:hypothetical protein M501DRAFT_997866 [Patellaria atrata CBS 101060]
MTETLTNGEKHSSQFISHLTSYPVVSDGITTYKSNPYGAKTLEVASNAYSKFASPVIPYLKGPYSYVAPYVAKADSLGDAGLSKVDSKFPIVKEDTGKLKGTVIDYAVLPLAIAGKGKEYLFNTYSDQYKKTGGDGVGTTVKAIISTEMKVGVDIYHFLLGYFNKGKETAKSKANDLNTST